MKKEAIINQFSKSLICSKPRKNEVRIGNITSTLITAAVGLAFVNESCKSSGKVSKSQVIYRKLETITKKEIQKGFQKQTLKFLQLLKLFSRNRKFLISFDTTKEAFYGVQAKAEDKLYLHEGSITAESYFYYEFLTVAITCNGGSRYILDGVIVPCGAYMEDYIQEMITVIKDYIPIECILFDRGFTSWILIARLKELKVPYMIFWRKSGEWYKTYFDEMSDGDFIKISRTEKYNEEKTNFKVSSQFVLVKQHEYDGKTFNWIFATNLDKESAGAYVKRYKKRWGIETIYRVTDDIRIYTTSTKAKLRYFLFMFTCFVYNIWKAFQIFLGEDFTLSNMKTIMIIFMAKKGFIYPAQYNQFEEVAEELL